MATVYSSPKEIKRPEFSFRDIPGSKQAEKDYIESIQAWVKARSKDKYAGELLRISHADGYACYIVFSTKPVKLVHLDIGDGWDAPLAHRLLGKDIVSMINMEKIFEQARKDQGK